MGRIYEKQAQTDDFKKKVADRSHFGWNIESQLYSVQCTLYSVQCTADSTVLFSVPDPVACVSWPSSVYSVQCAADSTYFIVYLIQEPVYHDWVEANDEEEGKEVTKDEEANLGKNKIKAWDQSSFTLLVLVFGSFTLLVFVIT